MPSRPLLRFRDQILYRGTAFALNPSVNFMGCTGSGGFVPHECVFSVTESEEARIR